MDSHPEESGSDQGRRRWLRRLALGSVALVSGVTLKRVTRNTWYEPHPPSPRPNVWATLVPRGFNLEYIYTGRPDGFGTGEAERTLWFRDHSRPDGTRNPLAVFYTTTQRVALAVVEGGPYRVIDLTLSNGVQVPAQYYFGNWQPSSVALPGETWEEIFAKKIWDPKTQQHNLTFTAEGFTVAVRGSGLVGVTADDIVRVAQNLDFSA